VNLFESLMLKINSTISSINLSWNEIGPAGGIALVDMLRVNTTVADIRIAPNSIDDYVIHLLSCALERNACLTSVFTGFTANGSIGFTSFVQMVNNNQSIEYVGIRNQSESSWLRLLEKQRRSTRHLVGLLLPVQITC